jgi:hypothetical protein
MKQCDGHGCHHTLDDRFLFICMGGARDGTVLGTIGSSITFLIFKIGQVEGAKSQKAKALLSSEIKISI